MSNRRDASPDPIVSIVVAAFNVEKYVDEALSSIRRQSLDAIEILIVDDGSTDATQAILARHASEDARVRLFVGEGRGPGAARNLAIQNARGIWISIVDADDVIAPDRLTRLVAEADRHAADAIADNMTAFYEAQTTTDHAWIDPDLWRTPRELTFADLMAGGLGTPPAPELGYLKPVLRRDGLALLGQPYRETLMIGEDFDLMARWTAAGLTYRYVPETTYRYRRHGSSLSYRLSSAQIERMIEALAVLAEEQTGPERAHVLARVAALEALGRYSRRVDRLKRGDLSALAPLLVDGDYRRRLLASAREGLGRRLLAK